VPGEPSPADDRRQSSDAAGAAPGSARRGLVAAHFQPAAAYLLNDPVAFPPQVAPILVEDADVGPILTHPHDIAVGLSIREAKTWEPGEGRFLRAILQPGMNALDVGANIGYFTLLMARQVGPAGRVLAIEAEPENFRYLRANVELNDLTNVELLPIAAHRLAGMVAIVRNPENQGGSRVLGEFSGQSWPVQAMRLDDVLDPDVPVDVVKIDIEGLDHAAVEGLSRTVRRWGPTLLVELNPANAEAGGDAPRDVLRFYRDLGLEIRLLGGDALRLQREAGMDISELLLDNLTVTPATEDELIERTRWLHFINLILTPAADRLRAR
jgi:FkbM family methyltransferase